MRITERARAAWIALVAGSVGFAAAPSNAVSGVRVEFHPDSVMTLADPASGRTGFDNSSLLLEADFEIGRRWKPAGTPMADQEFALEIVETQTLRDANQQGRPGEERNVEATWTSAVEWRVTNTTGREGPALLFFAGLQEFAHRSNPQTAGPEQYLPEQVGILMTEDFSVARFEAATGAVFYYLGFLLEDLGQPVDIRFEYQVSTDIIGLGTNYYGTPMLQVAAFFLPEPSSSLLTSLGLLGLLSAARGGR